MTEEAKPKPALPIAMPILDLLMKVSKTTGKRKKEQLLKDFSAHSHPSQVDALKLVLKYALDPFIRFGISCPEVEHNPSGTVDLDDPTVWGMLEHLRTTAGSGSLTDKTALVIDTLMTLNEAAHGLTLVVLDKDIGCGIGAKTIEKIFPGLLSAFNVMLASPFEEKRVKAWPVAIEPKYDGMRVAAHVSAAGAVSFYTRSGHEVPAMEGFAGMMLALRKAAGLDGAEVWFDGEITSGAFNSSISAARSSERMEEGAYTVFDMVIGNLLDDSDGALVAANGAYTDRRARLEAAFKLVNGRLNDGARLVELTPSYYASSVEEISHFYATLRASGMEGLIVKDLNGLYVRRRNPAWMKMKAELTADLRVIGAFEGTGQFEGQLGGLIVDYEGKEVRVGSGFSAAQRVEFWAHFQADLERIEQGRRDECLLIDCLAEVQYQEVTPDGSLRHPVFVRVRKDKREVSLF